MSKAVHRMLWELLEALPMPGTLEMAEILEPSRMECQAASPAEE